jgi:hypothetical protein
MDIDADTWRGRPRGAAVTSTTRLKTKQRRR